MNDPALFLKKLLLFDLEPAQFPEDSEYIQKHKIILKKSMYPQE